MSWNSKEINFKIYSKEINLKKETTEALLKA
jgi:hypothetical protein